MQPFALQDEKLTKGSFKNAQEVDMKYIFAPNPPWSNRNVILIFRAIVRQLETLKKFKMFTHLPQSFFQIKIGLNLHFLTTII
jgi:hypothetical protein